MTTFTWAIPNMERQTDDGFVYAAHWRCDASDGDYSASSYGVAGFSQDPQEEGFTPYDQLTEEQVLVWVWDKIDKESIEEEMQAKIDDQKHPTSVAGVPW